jgi:predicted phage tail protein
MEQNQLKHKAKTLAEVFQRSSANVEGRNGYLSRRHHQLRGLDHPRKRACLTAVHNFFLTRPDGTTAAERFFGQKPRSMFAAILGAVAIPPAPLSPPRRALGEAQRV